MRVLRHPDEFRPAAATASAPPPVWATLGTFDGVHLGHRYLIERLKQRAAEHAPPAQTLVITFEIHPKVVLSHRPPRPIISISQKLKLLREAGVDAVLLVHFDENISRISAEDFVREWLVERLGVAGVILGYDARFGHKAKGDFDLLAQMAGELGFVAEQGDAVKVGDEIVSSSAIREALSMAELDRAAMLLGRPFSMLGRVVEGDKRGTAIGFPTANFDIDTEVLVPLGVYVVRMKFLAVEPDAHHADISHAIATDRAVWGVANIGVRPTVNEPAPKPRLEVHAFDFSENIYGQPFEVEFFHHLRPEQKFPTFDALRAQIAADKQAAQDWLEFHGYR